MCVREPPVVACRCEWLLFALHLVCNKSVANLSVCEIRTTNYQNVEHKRADKNVRICDSSAYEQSRIFD